MARSPERHHCCHDPFYTRTFSTSNGKKAMRNTSKQAYACLVPQKAATVMNSQPQINHPAVHRREYHTEAFIDLPLHCVITKDVPGIFGVLAQIQELRRGSIALSSANFVFFICPDCGGRRNPPCSAIDAVVALGFEDAGIWGTGCLLPVYHLRDAIDFVSGKISEAISRQKYKDLHIIRFWYKKERGNFFLIARLDITSSFFSPPLIAVSPEWI
ncbi:hypothetical protein DFH06DRAFT_1138011 [Mycena polygramma]|nr:hypothetical protein DFH06DRAFT_1138011 [Mycena polygramma]